MQVVLSMVTDKHSSDTRASASMTIKPLFEAYIHAYTCLSPTNTQNIQNNENNMNLTQQELQSVFISCIDTLLVAIHGELNQDARSCAVEALRDLLLINYESGVEDVYCNRSQFLCHVTSAPPGTVQNNSNTTNNNTNSNNINTNTNMMESIIQQLLLCCSESFERRELKVKAYATSLLESSGANEVEEGDYDEILLEIENEEDLITVGTDGLGQILKICGKNHFMPYFDTGIGPSFLPFLLTPLKGYKLPGVDGSTTSTAMQIITTCLIDDILEYGYTEQDSSNPNPNSNPNTPVLLDTNQLQTICTHFIHALSSKNLLLKQSSSYGLAQMLTNYPSLFMNTSNTTATTTTATNSNSASSNMNNLLGSYMTCCSHPQSKDDDYIGITENCIYSLGLLLIKYRGILDDMMSNGSVKNESIIQMTRLWLQSLPLQADEKESKCSMNYLCDMLEQCDALILSNITTTTNTTNTTGGAAQSYENLEMIFIILAKSLIVYNKSITHPVGNFQEDSTSTSTSNGFILHILTYQRIINIIKLYIGCNGTGGVIGLPIEIIRTVLSKLKSEYQHVLINASNI